MGIAGSNPVTLIGVIGLLHLKDIDLQKNLVSTIEFSNMQLRRFVDSVVMKNLKVAKSCLKYKVARHISPHMGHWCNWEHTTLAMLSRGFESLMYPPNYCLVV